MKSRRSLRIWHLPALAGLQNQVLARSEVVSGNTWKIVCHVLQQAQHFLLGHLSVWASRHTPESWEFITQCIPPCVQRPEVLFSVTSKTKQLNQRKITYFLHLKSPGNVIRRFSFIPEILFWIFPPRHLTKRINSCWVVSAFEQLQ